MKSKVFTSSKLIFLGALFVIIALLTICLGLPEHRYLAFPTIITVLLITWFISKRSTTITNDAILVKKLLSQKNFPWENLKGLNISRSGKVYLIDNAGNKHCLPAVGPKDLPEIAANSQNRIILP